MENKLDFTTEMKELIASWKEKVFVSYIVNSEDEYITKVCLKIGVKEFLLCNDYISYLYEDGKETELTCFSLHILTAGKTLRPSSIGAVCKEYVVEQKIVKVFLIKDKELGNLIDTGKPYELIYNRALLVQTEKSWYAFWRKISFDTVEVSVGDTLEDLLKKIESVEEAQAAAQYENPNPITVYREMVEL